MLCSQNSGKYLSGKWHSDRAEAIRDYRRFTTDQLEFLEIDITTLPGPLGRLDIYDKTMNTGTTPVDPLDHKKDYDWRRNPEVGD